MNGNIQTLIDVYDNASSVETSPGKFTTVNELTDQVPAARPEVLIAAVESLMSFGPSKATKVLSEEDKGAIIAGMFSVSVGLPLAMARHNVTYRIPGSIIVPLRMEYMEGKLTVNGIKAGDEILLIDDTLASGGTMDALARAVIEAGASIVDIRVVTEKMGYGGRERLKWLDVDIQSVIGISLSDTGKVSVTHVLGEPLHILS